MRERAPATSDVPGCFTEASLLAHLDAGDAGVSSPQELAHLDGCSRCRILIAEVVHALDSGPVGAQATFGPGDQVADRYQIVRYVARGGMGEVYEARDLELGTTVALKTLLITALDDNRAASRLKTEVVLARKVTHPNVCRILEFGNYRPRDPHSRPIPFLTMPFLEGQTLEQRLVQGGPLRGPLLRSLVLDIVAGLEAIHQAGLIHRDLKTANVFVVKQATGEEQALVMDFGLARPFAETGLAGVANSGTIAGTLHYMAPEQLAGAPPSPAMDMYALGVVIFEMLTGRRPFEASTDEPGRAVLRSGPIPRPSRVSADVDGVWDLIRGPLSGASPGATAGRAECAEVVAGRADVGKPSREQPPQADRGAGCRGRRCNRGGCPLPAADEPRGAPLRFAGSPDRFRGRAPAGAGAESERHRALADPGFTRTCAIFSASEGIRRATAPAGSRSVSARPAWPGGPAGTARDTARHSPDAGARSGRGASRHDGLACSSDR